MVQAGLGESAMGVILSGARTFVARNTRRKEPGGFMCSSNEASCRHIGSITRLEPHLRVSGCLSGGYLYPRGLCHSKPPLAIIPAALLESHAESFWCLCLQIVLGAALVSTSRR